MNRIIINEQDITSNETPNISSDIVYVPGFAVGGTQEARVPKLCSTVKEFENAFGETAPTFLVDQVYPLKEGTTAGFSSLAIPTVSGADRIWYNAGTKDPSYVYAKELIRLGLSVVYERINTVSENPADKMDNSGTAGGKAVSLFSSTATYVVNDYVAYKGAYYKCIAAISTPEEGAVPSSDTNHWEAVSTDLIPWYDVTVERMYDAMMGANLSEDEYAIYAENVPGSLSEISTHNIKYITSGGYPTYEYSRTTGSGVNETTVTIAQLMTTLASTRGDAIAFIDHTDNAARPLTGDNSVYGTLKSGFLAGTTASFGTMITPWGVYDTTESSNVSLPGSFGYFVALARALRTYPSWLPIAGVVRGLIPTLKSLNTNKPLTNAVADSYQAAVNSTANDISINAITYINDQGYSVWGNRTMSNVSNGFATVFLNMRNLICDVKKQAFKSAQRYMFEQNTDILWVNFKNDMQKLLDQMVAGTAVKNFKILKLSTADKTKIAAKILIVPIYAVEAFEISIIMTDEEITVE